MRTTLTSALLAFSLVPTAYGCAIDDDDLPARDAKPATADVDQDPSRETAAASSGGPSQGAPTDPSPSPSSGSSSSSSSGATSSSGAPSTGVKRVFVTSLEYSGDLATAGSQPTGLAGGDALCAAHANDAGLGGTWVAWLSTSQVHAIDRLTSDGPWQLLDGTEVFTSRFDIQRSPAHAIDIDEQGEDAVYAYVFTGTDAHGQVVADGTCGDWKSASSARGMNGRSDSITAEWTADFAFPCSSPSRLYCFEQ